MAFTRRFLSALGIEADKVDEIINAHIEVVDGLKEERDNYKADAEKLADVQKELDTANDKLAKKGEGETVSKEDFDKLQKEYDDYKADVTAQETKRTKEHAVREFYKGVGISEKRIDSVVRIANLDEFELDKDGKIKDADKHTEKAKKEWADFITTQNTQFNNTEHPPANNGGTTKTKEDIMAIKDGAIRRQEMLNNPHLFGLENK
jgi:hypothetical protein